MIFQKKYFLYKEISLYENLYGKLLIKKSLIGITGNIA